MKEILEESKQQLLKPLGQARRKLLFILNTAYVILAIAYLVSEKVATGDFVHHPGLYLVYIPAIVINALSAVYNYTLFRYSAKGIVPPKGFLDILFKHQKRLDKITGWASMGLIMAMSFLNMVGVGNPSNDMIIADFALPHSLIIGAVIVVGRGGTFAWFLIVVAVLVYQMNRLGWDYQYHYMTPMEITQYEQALKNREESALTRKAELERAGLNPPKAFRYFQQWLIFLIVSFLAAYYFNGVTIDILKIIPSVANTLETAIQSSTRMELEREREKRIMEAQQREIEEEKYLAEEQKLLAEKEALRAELAFLKSQFDPHFLYNTLSYFYAETFVAAKPVAEGIMKLSDIMRYSLRENTDDRVPLTEEIHYVQNYIDIHQLRFSHRLCIQFEIEGTVEQKRILPLVFISFVENAFKHGDLTNAAMPLIIHLIACEESVDFYIRNRKGSSNGLSSTGIGLANVKRRLDLAYQDRYQLTIEEDEVQYTCQLYINEE